MIQSLRVSYIRWRPNAIWRGCQRIRHLHQQAVSKEPKTRHEAASSWKTKKGKNGLFAKVSSALFEDNGVGTASCAGGAAPEKNCAEDRAGTQELGKQITSLKRWA